MVERWNFDKIKRGEMRFWCGRNRDECAAEKRAPRRGAPTKMTHIPLLKAARRGGYAGCGCAPRIEFAFGDSASLRGIRGAVKRAGGTSASAEAAKKNAPYGR